MSVGPQRPQAAYDFVMSRDRWILDFIMASSAVESILGISICILDWELITGKDDRCGGGVRCRATGHSGAPVGIDKSKGYVQSPIIL